MKFSKFLSGIVIASAMVATISVDAATIGRSGGSSFSSASRSSSFSAPSRSTFSAPSAAPSRVGGIGGTSGSIGVRKSEVTTPVAQSVQAARTVPTPSYNSVPHTPSYNSVPTPSYNTNVPTPSTGGGFWSSFGGSFAGSAVSNALFNRPAPVVVAGGQPGVGTSAAVAPTVGSAPLTGTYAAPLVAEKSFGIGDFIINVILGVIAIIVLAGAAFLLYRGFLMSKNYINRERGVAPTQPFNPTEKFWEIQDAFSAGDKLTLLGLLGPDMTETLRDLEPSTNNIHGVSNLVVLNNPREFSVHYTFIDDTTVNQVWHYENIAGTWKLNGIENV